MENKAKSPAVSSEENTDQLSQESPQPKLETRPEKSWMKDLNLKPEDFSQCPEDQNPLLWAFESELLHEQTYTDWASVAYELPVLKSEFFEMAWDKTLRATFQDVFPWEKDCFPVHKWEDVLYVACLEPQQIPVDAKVCFLIASPKAMMNAWESLEELQQNPPQPETITPSADTVAPHTSEIVAAHPDLEPSVLNFDISALDQESPEPPPASATPSIPDDLTDSKSDDLSATPDSLGSSDLNPDFPSIEGLDLDDLNLESLNENTPQVETPPAETPSLDSLEGLDFGDLDLGGPPPPTMEAEQAPPTEPPKELQAEESPLETPPSLEGLDLTALAPSEPKSETAAPAASPSTLASSPTDFSSAPPSAAPSLTSSEEPSGSTPEAPPLDFDFDLPTEKTAQSADAAAPAAVDLSKTTPVSAPPMPPEILEPEVQDAPAPSFAAPEPPAPDLSDLSAPVATADEPKMATPEPPTLPVEAAPPTATMQPPVPVPVPTPPPAFDDDKTPPPIAAVPDPETAKPLAVSTAPKDKSITWEHLKGGPPLESCESLPQIVEHIFSKVHKDFEKLMWIPKAKSKGFIPDLVMGPWSPKDETWTTSVDIRNANIFRVAWSSKLPFHGPISPNSTNNKYFEMWDKGAMPEHITIFPLCTESKKCLGFIVGCGKGESFDKKDTLKRFQRLMELTAKQLGTAALDKAA